MNGPSFNRMYICIEQIMSYCFQFNTTNKWRVISDLSLNQILYKGLTTHEAANTFDP